MMVSDSGKCVTPCYFGQINIEGLVKTSRIWFLVLNPHGTGPYWRCTVLMDAGVIQGQSLTQCHLDITVGGQQDNRGAGPVNCVATMDGLGYSKHNGTLFITHL